MSEASAPDVSRHGMWSSRWLFVLAAAGSAVGLGNIWRFPYITGENGGGAFVVVYLLCIAAIGAPVMIAEVMLGRQGRQSPINTMRALAKRSGAPRAWGLVGWLGALTGFFILSYYTVIAGWALFYIFRMGSGMFTGADGALASGAFDAFLANPWLLAAFHTAFVAGTVFIVARGVTAGIERAVRWFMPGLFVLLFVLLGYAMTSGGFGAGLEFMFGMNWSALSVDGVLEALGHAFFTLSVGMGSIMAYGAYVPRSASISSTVLTIAALDTVVALIAGLAIFPVVFANGLEPGQGPGLMFVTVPLAFGQLPLGALFGVVFFVLVTIAAITSSISLLEPALAYAVETHGIKRPRAALALGLVCWVLGIGTVLSFNVWSDVHLVGQMTFFDFMDYATQKVMLPLGGLLIALFAGWVLPKTIVGEQLGLRDGVPALAWAVLIKVVAPLGVLAVFAYALLG